MLQKSTVQYLLPFNFGGTFTGASQDINDQFGWFLIPNRLPFPFREGMSDWERQTVWLKLNFLKAIPLWSNLSDPRSQQKDSKFSFAYPLILKMVMGKNRNRDYTQSTFNPWKLPADWSKRMWYQFLNQSETLLEYWFCLVTKIQMSCNWPIRHAVKKAVDLSEG